MDYYCNSLTFIEIELCTKFNVSHAQHFIVLTLINIEGGPRYKPPEVSRGSPVLHYSFDYLCTIATIVYLYMCNLINSCSSSSSST